ncbi:hypothetical protein F0562_005831 [Nyssa sinensis]|uniref:Uncharacterized protein n=1 Tax=Nyssa sinensis TaxID=561372 RepID=A0A5J5AMX9_9ASTE|nr:hypothetical protein F0562_005831 [Nyssa sinensis]
MSAVSCHTIDVNETVTISSQTSEDEISDSDDVYRLTYEDKAFVPSVGENLRNSTFNTTFSPSVNVEIHGGDDLSDFESNDDTEYNLSSEGSSTDEGEDSSCMWRIYASPLSDSVTYMIKTYKGDHTYVRLHSNSNANSSWIAKKLEETIKANLDMKVDAMQTCLQKTYGIKASKM